ncbi:unnamed protein product [Spirodela intermedia]|uniref:Deubiquitinating enzyme MINDY-3/4 conserved domain-containing protein n=1 Tax=Spirodela intermedia TaxID=51605 RepID=A0A7I8JFU0_SPIIN|nr:unnamed protein product [Spirodela intermedia]CAA6668383.1 unnamed protein product [Spirodela intermedia]
MEYLQDEEDLKMALLMSLQSAPSEAKRSKPPEDAEESPEARGRRLRREVMAAAAERRMATSRSGGWGNPVPRSMQWPCRRLAFLLLWSPPEGNTDRKVVGETRQVDVGELCQEDANRLFSMLFGGAVSKSILLQWTNQGIRFSSDHETCMGLVQHKGGPCGILAPIQAFVLKYLLFFPTELDKVSPSILQPEHEQRRFPNDRTLVLSMVEILFLCGNKKRAAVATLSIFTHHADDELAGEQKNEAVSEALEDLSVESASDLKKYLRVSTHDSPTDAYNHLMAELPVFQSRMGAVLFLISALLSRGLDAIQADRDDPSLPLVTSPFGHASQEIVNLLICGEAVANVFDGRMDLGGGMSLKGIPGGVEVGFLTLLESLNYCKVGQFLKRPRWPIWVVGSESHYTVLFALDAAAQAENELEEREAKIRAAFDAQDQSGGGGFIGVDGFHQVLRDAAVALPPEKVSSLCAAGFIVWNEFWQALLDLDQSNGGLKDSSGKMGKKQFDVFHFNGIAKSVPNGGAPVAGGEVPLQRPRLSKLHVSVPPKWTQEEFMTDIATTAAPSSDAAAPPPPHPAEPAQHAPLVDCIRTRWPRATCSWDGDSPSIV